MSEASLTKPDFKTLSDRFSIDEQTECARFAIGSRRAALGPSIFMGSHYALRAAPDWRRCQLWSTLPSYRICPRVNPTRFTGLDFLRVTSVPGAEVFLRRSRLVLSTTRLNGCSRSRDLSVLLLRSGPKFQRRRSLKFELAPLASSLRSLMFMSRSDVSS